MNKRALFILFLFCLPGGTAFSQGRGFYWGWYLGQTFLRTNDDKGHNTTKKIGDVPLDLSAEVYAGYSVSKPLAFEISCFGSLEGSLGKIPNPDKNSEGADSERKKSPAFTAFEMLTRGAFYINIDGAVIYNFMYLMDPHSGVLINGIFGLGNQIMGADYLINSEIKNKPWVSGYYSVQELNPKYYFLNFIPRKNTFYLKAGLRLGYEWKRTAAFINFQTKIFPFLIPEAYNEGIALNERRSRSESWFMPTVTLRMSHTLWMPKRR